VADLEDVPAEIKNELEFIGVSRMEDVLKLALEDPSRLKLDAVERAKVEAAPAS
jgi:ATP-dependent Lon protease